MTMTDPIADLFTRIRNALGSKKDRLDVPVSKAKLEVCRILKEQGFIRNYAVIDGVPQGTVRIALRYSDEGAPAISHLAKVSRPGRRIYRGADDLPQVRNGLGVGIVSTSQGLMTDAQARERRVGGEVLGEIW
jgi:small subunit ribosomal protein S8